MDDLPLPESVHGLIAARLDALRRGEDAAPGRGGDGQGVLVRALGGDGQTSERLHSLERKDFIRGERRSSVDGEQEFAFRHVLVRDVAYGQIHARAAAMHVRAAGWIESLGRPLDHAELHHYLAALELDRSQAIVTSDVRERALRALGDARERAR